MALKKRWKAKVEWDIKGPDFTDYKIVPLAKWRDWQDFLATYKDKEIAVTVTPWKSTTSTPQFRYYYGVVLELIAEETGIDKDSLDTILKSKFLYEYTLIGGVAEKRPLSKTEVTTDIFCKYVDEVVRWAQKFLALVIPEPNEAEPVGVSAEENTPVFPQLQKDTNEPTTDSRGLQG